MNEFLFTFVSPNIMFKKDTDYIVEGMIRARPGLPVNPKTREEHTQAKQAMKAQQTHKQGG